MSDSPGWKKIYRSISARHEQGITTGSLHRTEITAGTECEPAPGISRARQKGANNEEANRSGTLNSPRNVTVQ